MFFSFLIKGPLITDRNNKRHLRGDLYVNKLESKLRSTLIIDSGSIPILYHSEVSLSSFYLRSRKSSLRVGLTNFKLIVHDRHKPIRQAWRRWPQYHHGKGIIYFASHGFLDVDTVLKAQGSFNQFISCWTHPLKFTLATLSGMKLSKDITQQDSYLTHTHTHLSPMSFFFF